MRSKRSLGEVPGRPGYFLSGSLRMPLVLFLFEMYGTICTGHLTFKLRCEKWQVFGLCCGNYKKPDHAIRLPLRRHQGRKQHDCESAYQRAIFPCVALVGSGIPVYGFQLSSRLFSRVASRVASRLEARVASVEPVPRLPKLYSSSLRSLTNQPIECVRANGLLFSC